MKHPTPFARIDPKRLRKMRRRSWLKRTFHPRLYWADEAICNLQEELGMANAYIADLVERQIPDGYIVVLEAECVPGADPQPAPAPTLILEAEWVAATTPQWERPSRGVVAAAGMVRCPECDSRVDLVDFDFTTGRAGFQPCGHPTEVRYEG